VKFGALRKPQAFPINAHDLAVESLGGVMSGTWPLVRASADHFTSSE
jgi:hypothetical protein